MPRQLQDDPVTRRSAWLAYLFTHYVGWYFGRNFRALRIARDGLPDLPPGRPIIICTNHPSWWDPLIYVLLMRKLFPGRRGFGPMDQASLGRYGLLRRLGIFGIAPGRQGAAAFLRTGARILQHDSHILWITGEGGFTDPRVRPVRLRPGIAHLARRAEKAVIVPMAVEYCFWNERFPEALVRFGRPIDSGVIESGVADIADWTTRLETALCETMDRLAEDAISRDPTRFRRLRGGRSGMGGVYDLYRRLRAGLRGDHFDPDHTPDSTRLGLKMPSDSKSDATRKVFR